MEGKYYTPEMDEFTLGFPCELQTMTGWVQGEFPEILEKNPELDQYKDTFMKLAHSIIRCKYLDRQDIEAEGWKFKDDYNYTLTETQFSNYNIYFKLRIVGSIISIWSDETKFQYFVGTIRNRSELKRLMLMLGLTKK